MPGDDCVARLTSSAANPTPVAHTSSTPIRTVGGVSISPAPIIWAAVGHRASVVQHCDAVKPVTARLISVDVLRGATMAGMVIVNTPGDWSNVYWPLLHAEWHGWTPTDLIFP